MTQQYPDPYGSTQFPQPAPQKKKRTGLKITLGVIGAIVVISVIGGCTGGSDTSTPASNDKAAASAPASSAPAKSADPVTSKSEAQELKDYVSKNGTAEEKAAAAHIVKVQGADTKNNILDNAGIYTDLSGGLVGPDADKAKLLVSAFTDWEQSRGKESKNGLVTVYDKNGALLSNGNY